MQKYFDAVCSAVADNAKREKKDRLRLGQIHYNVLFAMKPDLALGLAGTEADPFYQDSRLNKFFDWLESNWEKPDGPAGLAGDSAEGQ